MNYPWNFPGGPAAFWAAFPFQFDDLEVIHLRRAFRNNGIMGGSPFITGSALEQDPAWADPVVDEWACGSSSPLFEPLMQHCRSAETVTLRAGDEPVSDSAFVHYGQDGLVFDTPGRYTLRARYDASDGSLVLSNMMTIRVRPPASETDNDVAELLLGEEQGILMSLLGSDAPSLDRGNEAFQEAIERYPDHPLTAYASIVRGTNLAREFKSVNADGSVSVRKPQKKEALKLLGAVTDVEAVRSAAKDSEDDMSMRMAAADALPQANRTEAPTTMDPFLKARRVEIATEVVGLS
jgi:hypothetical protein